MEAYIAVEGVTVFFVGIDGGGKLFPIGKVDI